MTVPPELARLPAQLRQRAFLTDRGEYAWRGEDVEAVISAARQAGLACVGGQPLFRHPRGICDAYWLNYDSGDRGPTESWRAYAERSCDEVQSGFRRIYKETDFLAEARNWSLLSRWIDTEGGSPAEILWFFLYFEEEQHGSP